MKSVFNRVVLAVSSLFVGGAAMAQTASTDPSTAITSLTTWVGSTLTGPVVALFAACLILFLGIKLAKRGANKA